jgi:hypothetical protein
MEVLFPLYRCFHGEPVELLVALEA